MYSADSHLAVGLPHSEISGSRGVRASPELIAAYYVLHRLFLPRHSPNALRLLDPYQITDARYQVSVVRIRPTFS